MKKIILLLTIFNFQFSIFNIAFSQAPAAIPFQAIARDNAGDPIISMPVTLRFSMHDVTDVGTIVYREVHSITTSSLGYFLVNIGEGAHDIGTFASINWGTGAKYLEIEIDAAGGFNFVSMGTQQMLSVPYALHSGSSDAWTILGNNISNKNIGSVGIGTTTPQSSALLDVNSTTKGFLPPRMTYLERAQIANPAPGLIVWCSDCGGGQLQVSNGTTWTNLIGGAAANPPFLTIGQNYQGGIIAYLLQPGDLNYDPIIQHGLIVAPTDLLGPWGCYPTGITGTSPAIGMGQANTTIIINSCSQAGIAARLCDDLVLGGYSDWFLPSSIELVKINLNLLGNVNGGFTNASYWSSTEFSPQAAIFLIWSTGQLDASYYHKTAGLYVRATRYF